MAQQGSQGARKVALRSELLKLKARVDGLQEQVRALEERLSALLIPV
jgi:polyhydroxyalkanoate synthesis regulator phasin